MRADEALRKYSAVLNKHGVEQSEDEAKVLLCHILNVNVAQLFAQHERQLTSAEEARVNDLIHQRLEGMPVAYLINRRGFYGMELYVDQRVLIPRPETELLVEEALRFNRHWGKEHAAVMRIADIGTGSGAIAVALAANIPDSLIYAVDISEDALYVAGINIQRHRLEDKVHLMKGNLLKQINGKLDMVVANLPYIKKLELPLLPVEISRYEPEQALSGGINGTEIIQELIRQSATKIATDGVILIEFGIGQEDEIIRAAAKWLSAAKTEVIKDLSGINRILKITASSFDNRIGLL